MPHHVPQDLSALLPVQGTDGRRRIVPWIGGGGGLAGDGGSVLKPSTDIGPSSAVCHKRP